MDISKGLEQEMRKKIQENHLFNIKKHITESRDNFLKYLYSKKSNRDSMMQEIRKKCVLTLVNEETQKTPLLWIDSERCKIEWRESIFISQNENDTITDSLSEIYNNMFSYLSPSLQLQDGVIKLAVKTSHQKLYLMKKNGVIQLGWRVKIKK